MQQRELISYYLVDVDSGKSEITQKNPSDFEDSGDFYPLCIELQGTDLVNLGKEFLVWRGKASEITFRLSSSQKAFVIFSRLNPDEFLRPDDVIAPLLWPEEKLASFSQNQKSDEKKEIILQLDTMYFHDQEQKKSHLLSFLEQLYSINPQKEKITLGGKVPPYVFLLTVDWFSGKGKSKSLFYHTDKLV